MKYLSAFAVMFFFSFGVFGMNNLGALEEIQFPADDLATSTKFYEKLGFKVVHTEEWGFVQLKRGSNETVALLKPDFQKEISLSYKSPNILALKNELDKAEIKVEDDGTTSERVKTLSFRDPSGNLIFVFQGR